MSQVPFYLDPNPQGDQYIFPSGSKDVVPLTYDFNFPPPQGRGAEVSDYDILGSFGDAFNSGLQSFVTGVKGAYSGIKEEAISNVDAVLWRGAGVIALLVAGVVVLIWILGKSGVSKDIVGGLQAVF